MPIRTTVPLDARVARVIARHQEIYIRLLDESIALGRRERAIREGYPLIWAWPPEVIAELEAISVRGCHLWHRLKHHEPRLKRHSIAWMIAMHEDSIGRRRTRTAPR